MKAFSEMSWKERKSIGFFAALKFIFEGQITHRAQVPGRVIQEIEQGIILNKYKEKHLRRFKRIGINVERLERNASRFGQIAID